MCLLGDNTIWCELYLDLTGKRETYFINLNKAQINSFDGNKNRDKCATFCLTCITD